MNLSRHDKHRADPSAKLRAGSLLGQVEVRKDAVATVFPFEGGAGARGRKPGSLHSADSGRDDTKKGSVRRRISSAPQTPIGMTQRKIRRSKTSVEEPGFFASLSIALCSGSLRRGGVICFADHCWETETVDNDIHHAENACLPAGLVVHQAHPDHRADQICGVDI